MIRSVLSLPGSSVGSGGGGACTPFLPQPSPPRWPRSWGATTHAEWDPRQRTLRWRGRGPTQISGGSLGVQINWSGVHAKHQTATRRGSAEGTRVAWRLLRHLLLTRMGYSHPFFTFSKITSLPLYLSIFTLYGRPAVLCPLEFSIYNTIRNLNLSRKYIVWNLISRL